MQQIRQSMLNDYLQCPHMCFHRWGRYGEVEPPGSFVGAEEFSDTNKYASVGTAIHSVMEEWGKKRQQGIDLSVIDLQNHVLREIKNIPDALFDNMADRMQFAQSATNQIAWLKENHCLTVPKHLELTFTDTILIPGELPFAGTIDRVDGEPERRLVKLIDYKSGKTYTKKQLQNNVQVGIYCLWWKSQYGFLPSEFVFLFSKFSKEKVVLIDEDYINNSVRVISDIMRAIKQNAFNPPYSRNKHFCSNFCKFKSVCVAYKKSPEGWENVGT